MTEERQMLQALVSGFELLQAQFDGFRTEVRQELRELRGDVAELKGDVAELKGDVAELKGDVAELKTGMAALNEKVDAANIRLSRLEKRTLWIEDDMIQTRERLSRLEQPI